MSVLPLPFPVGKAAKKPFARKGEGSCAPAVFRNDAATSPFRVGFVTLAEREGRAQRRLSIHRLFCGRRSSGNRFPACRHRFDTRPVLEGRPSKASAATDPSTERKEE
jgi:hypothetical protein